MVLHTNISLDWSGLPETKYFSDQEKFYNIATWMFSSLHNFFTFGAERRLSNVERSSSCEPKMR